MISKTEISGWWGNISRELGWSYKISKWKWVAFHTVFSVVLITIFFLLIAFFIEDRSLLENAWIGYSIVIISSLIGHKEWNRDQQKMKDKEDMITL